MKTMKYALAALTATAVMTQAGLVAPTAVHNVSSSLDDVGWGTDRAAVHTIDGSGLTGMAHSIGEDGVAWTTVGPYGATDYDPFITYDLGVVTTVTGIHEWGYNDNFVDSGTGVATTGFSPNAVDLYVSVDGVSFILAESVNFAQATGVAGYTGNYVDLTSDLVGVRYIRLDIMSNHDGAIFDGTGAVGGADGRSLTGLSEIRFDAIPEPATLGMVASFGAAIFFVRRKLMI